MARKYTVSTATGICDVDPVRAEQLHNLTGCWRAGHCDIWGYGFYSIMTADEIVDRLHKEHRNLCPICWRRTALARYINHDFTKEGEPRISQEDEYAKGVVRSHAMLAVIQTLTSDAAPEVKEQNLQTIRDILKESEEK